MGHNFRLFGPAHRCDVREGQEWLSGPQSSQALPWSFPWWKWHSSWASSREWWEDKWRLCCRCECSRFLLRFRAGVYELITEPGIAGAKWWKLFLQAVAIWPMDTAQLFKKLPAALKGLCSKKCPAVSLLWKWSLFVKGLHRCPAVSLLSST